MNFLKRSACLLVFLAVVVSVFSFYGCKKEESYDRSNGIIVVPETVFNEQVKSPLGIKAFSVSALKQYDVDYLIEEQVYYVLAYFDDIKFQSMSLNFSGATVIEDQIFIKSTGSSQYLEINKEINEYTGALTADITNSEYKVKENYHLAVGVRLTTGFSEEVSFVVDTYINQNGIETWDESLRTTKETAYKKHVSVESSIKFITDSEYRSGSFEDKLKQTLSMTLGEKYYAVIDYTLSSPAEINENDMADITVTLTDPNAVWENGVCLTHRFDFNIEDFPTAVTESDARGVKASFALKFSEDGTLKRRFIISVVPISSVNINIEAKLSGEGISFVIGGKAKASISTIEAGQTEKSLQYQLSGDGKYYTVIGLGTENRDKITVPATYNDLPVREIAADTFARLTYLKEIRLPSSIQKIGNNAFEGCTGLKFIVIPSETVSISENAFNNCELTIYYVGATVPSGWVSGFNPEGLSVYTSCKKTSSNLKFTLNSDGLSYTVSGGDCQGGKVIIPAVYDNYPVTHIAAGLSNFSSITLPTPSISIEENALKNTENLTEAIIPIGALGHIKTDKLQNVTFTDGNAVPALALKNCSSLKTVTLCDTVTSIGADAFYGCALLTNVNFGKGLQSIGNRAFYNCKMLSDFDLPSSVKTVGEYAFSGCASLTKAIISDNVTSLGKYAFEYCTSIKEISLGKGITVIPEGAFRYVGGINSYTVPSHVSAIDKFAFYGCYGLVSVDISNVWLDNIGEKAFYDCNSLIEVVQEFNYVTKGSTANGHLGFYARTVGNTTNIVKSGDYLFYVYQADIQSVPDRYLVKYVGKGGDITLPEDYNGYAYKIYPYAFYNVDTVSDVTVGGKISEIGNYAFYDCDGIFGLDILGDVLSIGEYAFFSCDELYSLEIDGSTELISVSAFEDCKSLYNVTLGKNVEKLSDRAFYGCNKLFSVRFSVGSARSSVYYIGESAFEGCTGLKNTLELPGSLMYLYEKAFYGCTGITAVKLGNIVELIGEGAFNGCTSLESITVGEYNPDYISENGVLYCIKDEKTLIKYPEGKKDTSFTAANDVLVIGKEAFSGAKYLKCITFYNTLTTVEYGAFAYCTALTDINYTGTVSQWVAISWADGWDSNMPTSISVNWNYTPN